MARVEEVAAKEPTRIIVAYVQEMRGRSEPYRVALAGLGELRELGIKLRARGPLTIGGDPAFSGVRGDGEFARFGEIRPTGDFVVNPQGPRELGLRHENMVVARISPVPHDHPAPLDNLSILFDTSASQSLGWDTHVDRLGQLVAELGVRVIDDVPLRVVCFDQGVEIGYDGTLRKSRRPTSRRSAPAVRSGRRNLAGALRFAAGVGERPPGRMILMTDGLVTAGAQGEAQLLAEAERLRAAGVGRVDVIVEGGAADPALLKTLTSLTRLSPSHPGWCCAAGCRRGSPPTG